MVLSNNVESIVKLNNLYFDKIDFWYSGMPIPDKELALAFNASYEFNDNHDSCVVTLNCCISDKSEEHMRLELSINGSFTCDEDSFERRDALLKKNTLAILFPYLRSQISIVTAQPNFAPIVLPPININAVLDSINEN